MIKIKRRYPTGFLVVCLLIALLGLASHPVQAASGSPEVTIEAQGEMDYDTETNTTIANDQVKMTDGDVTITSDHLIYNNETGVANASGSVKVVRKDGVVYTESLTYHVKAGTGETDLFHGTINDSGRNIQVRGTELNTTTNTFQFSKGVLTRCPLEKPHYTLNAKKIFFKDHRVFLKNAVLKIFGVPVFYFPQLSFRTNGDGKDFPIRIESGYNTTDGVWVRDWYTRTLNNNLDWYVSGKIISNQSDSHHQAETGLTIHGPLGKATYTDTISLNQEINGYSKLANSFAFNTRNFLFTLDGYDYSSAANKNELGVSLTRKYWPSPIGNWQLGVQARRMAAYWGTAAEYGGTYGGFQLDYQPLPQLTLSFLNLNDFKGNTNYGDFGPNLGSSLMLSWGKSLTPYSQLGISGSYNTNRHDVTWNIVLSTCCYGANIGWDAAQRIFSYSLSFNF